VRSGQQFMGKPREYTVVQAKCRYARHAAKRRQPVSRAEATLMLMLFRVCRDERQARWVVLVEDRLYGEYLDKERAVLDAIDAATETREGGNEVEVWEQSLRLY
jgi:hypothetical protein